MEAVLPFLLVAQGVLGGVDTLIENRIRVQHLFLALNVGLIVAVVIAMVWIITAFGAAAAYRSVRDFVAWHRLRHATVAA